MNLLPDAQKIRPPLINPITMRPHFDGFVVDQ
jgi:galactonate dehydratase